MPRGWMLGRLSCGRWRGTPLASGAEGGQRLPSPRHQLFMYFLLFLCCQKKKKKRCIFRSREGWDAERLRQDGLSPDAGRRGERLGAGMSPSSAIAPCPLLGGISGRWRRPNCPFVVPL